MRADLTKAQQCAAHLWDLCRGYPDDPARPQARALLEPYRIRGAEIRQLAASRAAQADPASRASPARRLAQARRRLIKILHARGGLTVAPARPERTMTMSEGARHER
jgi:hypothetical protein